jgi:hypothetical protein
MEKLRERKHNTNKEKEQESNEGVKRLPPECFGVSVLQLKMRVS